MSYGKANSGEFAPDPTPFTCCPVCGTRVPATWDEDTAHCRWHAHLVSRNTHLSPEQLAEAFGEPADRRAA